MVVTVGVTCWCRETEKRLLRNGCRFSYILDTNVIVFRNVNVLYQLSAPFDASFNSNFQTIVYIS